MKQEMKINRRIYFHLTYFYVYYFMQNFVQKEHREKFDSFQLRITFIANIAIKIM